MCVLELGKVANTWRLVGQKETESSPVWRRCENFSSPAGCNWLVPAAETEPLCVACRLNRTIPDLADEKNRQWWRVIENAKRRLVAQLLYGSSGLGRGRFGSFWRPA